METNYTYPQDTKNTDGNVLTGLIGALIGAVIGAVVWAIISILTDSVFALVGLGVGFLVCWGYDLLKGKTGAIRVVIVIICLILAIVAGDTAYYGWLINDDYQYTTDLLTNGTNDEIAQYFFTEDAYEQYQAANIFDKNYNIALIKDEYTYDSLNEYYEAFYKGNEEITESFIGDLALSLFFGLLGSLALILSKAKNNKQTAQANQAAIENARVPSDSDGYVTADSFNNVGIPGNDQNDNKQDPFAL